MTYWRSCQAEAQTQAATLVGSGHTPIEQPQLGKSSESDFRLILEFVADFFRQGKLLPVYRNYESIYQIWYQMISNMSMSNMDQKLISNLELVEACDRYLMSSSLREGYLNLTIFLASHMMIPSRRKMVSTLPISDFCCPAMHGHMGFCCPR